MFCKHAFSGLGRIAFPSVFLFPFFTPLASLAADGMIVFRGAVTEPVCSVNVAHAGVSPAMFERLRLARGPSRIDTGALHLTMSCHADQAVHLSFEGQPSASAAAGADSGSAGVEVVLSRVGKDLQPGEAIALALAGKRDNNIDIGTALRKTAAAPGDAGMARLDGGILVSLNYR